MFLNNEIKAMYTDVFTTLYSPCGNFLIAGDIYGRIFVFDLRLILNPEREVKDKKQKAQLLITADENGQVNSLASTDKFLIVGCTSQIIAYEWKPIQSLKQPKVAWKLQIPPTKDNLSANEVNGMVLNEQGRLLAGCGDGKIHSYSLEDGKLMTSLSGHSNSIRTMTTTDKKQVVSGGEDGLILFWDARTNKPCHTLEPSKENSLVRPVGKYVGVVHVEKDWLSCAGGFKPSLWHLGTMQLATSFDTLDRGTYVCQVHEDRVLVGDANKLAQFSLQGDLICSIQGSASQVYTACIQEQPHKVLVFGGASPDIDLCTNFNYKDLILSCALE